MKFQRSFQKDLFGPDSSLFGWPSDGLDEPAVQAADLRTVAAQTLRVKLPSGAPRAKEAIESLADEAACARDRPRSGVASGHDDATPLPDANEVPCKSRAGKPR